MRANWSPDFSSLALANSSRRSEKSHRSIMGVPARRDHVIEKVLSGALQFVGIFGRVIHKVFLCSEMSVVDVAFTNTQPTPGLSASGKLGTPARDTNTATGNLRNLRSKPPRRHHPRHKTPDDLRLMLARGAFKRVRPLEGIGTSNLHFPLVIRLRGDDRNTPIPGPIRKGMLNDGHNLRPHRRHAARVMHLHRNCHAAENITVPPPPANPALPVRPVSIGFAA